MKIFLEYNNILCDKCMKRNFNMIVQFYKLNLFRIIQKIIFNIKTKLNKMINNILQKNK